MELQVFIMNGHQISIILMVETIEHRSPGIAVIAFKYVYIEIPAFFVFNLIVTHSAPHKTWSLFCHVHSIMIIDIFADFLRPNLVRKLYGSPFGARRRTRHSVGAEIHG